eukprot:4876658-Amphidinium_carterae.1
MLSFHRSTHTHHPIIDSVLTAHEIMHRKEDRQWQVTLGHTDCTENQWKSSQMHSVMQWEPKTLYVMLYMCRTIVDTVFDVSQSKAYLVTFNYISQL